MIKSGKLLLTAILLATGCSSEAQQNADREMHIQELLAAPNPLEASDSVWIEALTYIEVRDRIADGHYDDIWVTAMMMVKFRAQYTANAIRTSIANK